MSDEANQHEQLLKSERVLDGSLIDVTVDTVRLPDGKQTQRETVQHPGAVAMVPLLDGDRVVLVRQFRYAVQRHLLEIPAGTLEPGEDLLAAASRELQEETGYRPGKLARLGAEFPAPGYTPEVIHLYLATELIPSRLEGDPDEFVQTVIMPFDRVLGQVLSGEITDGKTMLGMLLVARRLGR